MLPNEKHFKVFVLIILSLIVFGGCAGRTPAPPYFKGIYETTRALPATPETGVQQGGAAGKVAALVESKKPLVKIIAIPDPNKKETVSAAAEKRPGFAPA